MRILRRMVWKIVIRKTAEMKTENFFEEVKSVMLYIEEVSARLGQPITATDYYIENLGCPHRKPKNLPKGYGAVYMFAFNGEWLKIGKVNSKSQARFTSQHYSFNAMSTLSKSLAADKKMQEYGICRETSRAWVEQNTYRINILVKAEIGIAATELIEAMLHYKFRPRSEGKTIQNT